MSTTACRGREPEPVRPPGLVDSEGRQLVAPPKPAPLATTPAPEPPTTYDFERPAPSYPTPAQNLGLSPPPSKAGGSAQPTSAARDLSAELSSALNQVTDCIDLALVAGRPDGRLVVSVTAQVQATGSIYRATVDAAGQPSKALECVQNKVLALKLKEPVPGAPIPVQGTTEVQVKSVGAKPPAAGATPPAKAAPPPPNPDMARGEPGDTARPDPSDLAGPP